MQSLRDGEGEVVTEMNDILNVTKSFMKICIERGKQKVMCKICF